MTDLFKGMVEQNYHEAIFEALQTEITDNYCEHDLEHRANVVCQVMEADLDYLEILRVKMMMW